jgi:hypothetical protein
MDQTRIEASAAKAKFVNNLQHMKETISRNRLCLVPFKFFFGTVALSFLFENYCPIID